MNRQRQRAGRWALVDRSLRVQIRVFLGIFAVMAALAIARIVRDDVNPLWALAGFGAGLAIGFLLARVKVRGWDPSERVVVGTTDAVGIVILVAYLAFLLVRNRFIGGRVDDAEAVGVIGLATTGGAMLGRVYFTLRGIRRVLAVAGVGVADRPESG